MTVNVRLTVNVLCLVDIDLANGKLTVGGLSGAVTAGKVVNDKGSNLVATDVLDGILDGSDLGAGVAEGRSVGSSNESCVHIHPEISTDRSDLGSLGLQCAVGDGGSS